jgi:hypothetical protein
VDRVREIVVGANGFRDCGTLVAIDGHPILSVADDGHVVLRLPPRSNESSRLEIDGPVVNTSDDSLARQLTVSGDTRHVVVFFVHHLIFVTSNLGTTTHVYLDLRPLGLNLYSDSTGLHVGPHTLFNLSFVSESPAISISMAEGRPPTEPTPPGWSG